MRCLESESFAPENAWRIIPVDGDDSVVWLTEDPKQPRVEPHNPASMWRRFLESIEEILPIAHLL